MWFERRIFGVCLDKSDIFLNCLWGNPSPSHYSKYTHLFITFIFFLFLEYYVVLMCWVNFLSFFPFPYIACLLSLTLPTRTLIETQAAALDFIVLKKIPMKCWILYNIWHWFIFLNERWRWGEPKLFRKLSSKWAKELQLMRDLR